MEQSITITGRPGGDCECFCFHVTADEYLRLMGEDALRQAQEEIEELRNMGVDEELDYKIYPDELLRLLQVDDKDPITVEIKIHGRNK